jgi:hypothetical protein
MSFTLEEVRDGLVPGSIHYFKILAVNDVGDSLFSEEASFALAPLPSQLSAPALVQVESDLATGSLLIRWTGAPAIAPGGGLIAVTGYRLYMDGGNDGYYRLVHDGTGEPGTLEYTVTAAAHGVVVGRAYRFKVSALNFNGEGPASSESLIHACLSPASFSAPRYVTSDETTLSIEWAAPNATNGCPIDKY